MTRNELRDVLDAVAAVADEDVAAVGVIVVSAGGEVVGTTYCGTHLHALMGGCMALANRIDEGMAASRKHREERLCDEAQPCDEPSS